MTKFILIFLVCVLFFEAADAQNDTSLYYLKNSGALVSTKDSADLLLMILPPDPVADKKISVVKCYYLTGKINFIAGSLSHGLPLNLQGPYISFFPNGHKKSIESFKQGQLDGDVVEYYPNGKVHDIKKYSIEGMRLKQCNDSIGNVLAKDGKGKWREYSDDFKKVVAEGTIMNGLQEGRWFEVLPDSVRFERVYGDGAIIYSTAVYRYTVNDEPLRDYDIKPEFPGGKEAFEKFVSQNLEYPKTAKDNGVQGRVMVAFVVEKNGYLDNIKVITGIGDNCDEEAARLIQLSPSWKAGTKNGRPVRVQYSAPIDFVLTGK